MTDRRFDENDLLGWIEGDLPTDRAHALEKAMRDDAGLRHTLDAMRRDRSMLRAEFVSIWHEAGAKAPLRTVQEAIEAAERDAILNTSGQARPARTGVLAVIGRHRGLAMAASLGLMVTAGALVWTSTGPTSGPGAGPQIAGGDAMSMTGALNELLAIESAQDLPTTDSSAGDSALVAIEPASPELTPEQIDTAIALAERAESDRTRLASTITRTRSDWSELQARSPVLPSRVRGPYAVTTPVLAGASQPDASLANWERNLTTYSMGGRDRAFSSVSVHDIPEVVPASYDDAVRLAGLNRLALRVVSDDPRAVEQELFKLAALHGLQIELESMGDACGIVSYSVHLPDGQPEDMERLVQAICACAGGQSVASRRTYFDVTALPAEQRPASIAGVNASMGRVSVPVRIEPVGVH